MTKQDLSLEAAWKQIEEINKDMSINSGKLSLIDCNIKRIEEIEHRINGRG